MGELRIELHVVNRADRLSWHVGREGMSNVGAPPETILNMDHSTGLFETQEITGLHDSVRLNGVDALLGHEYGEQVIVIPCQGAGTLRLQASYLPVSDRNDAAVKDDLDSLCDPSRFVGRAPEQVEEYLAAEIDPLLAEHEQAIAGLAGEVRV